MARGLPIFSRANNAGELDRMLAIRRRGGMADASQRTLERIVKIEAILHRRDKLNIVDNKITIVQSDIERLQQDIAFLQSKLSGETNQPAN